MASLRIRKYPHFDGDLTLVEAEALVSDPVAVSRHGFFPFIESAERWTKFAAKGQVGTPKNRPIRYAARKDACIYSHYREILACLYEAKLKSLGVGESVIAYRRIPKDKARGNKSSIDFANDVFERIISLGDCQVYALDIKGFFEHIDHVKLKSVWADLLNVQRLPDDHHSVFKNITKFSWVDRDRLYRLLGFIGKKKRADGKTVTGYRVKRIPLQVCNSRRFRREVCALIETNDLPHGIPQGSPISDVLANMYLMDFDAKMVAYMAVCKGFYFRYSDDILLIVPGSQDDIAARIKTVQDTLNSCGDKLEISTKKSAVHRFNVSSVDGLTTRTCTLVYGTQGKNGLEYLGFRFDGERVYIRDSTRAGLNRKIVAAARKLARIHANINPSMAIAELEQSFNHNFVITKFGRVDDFESNARGYRGWTFWTYAIRAHETFGAKGKPIIRQLRSHKMFIRRKANEALARYAKQP